METVLHFIDVSFCWKPFGPDEEPELGRAAICQRSHGLAIKGELKGAGWGGVCPALPPLHVILTHHYHLVVVWWFVCGRADGRASFQIRVKKMVPREGFCRV